MKLCGMSLDQLNYVHPGLVLLLLDRVALPASERCCTCVMETSSVGDLLLEADTAVVTCNWRVQDLLSQSGLTSS